MIVSDGHEVFSTKEMTRSGNKYAAQIPAGATKGKSVVYFIEAQDSEGTVLASAGGESKPIAVALGAGEGGGKKCASDDEDCEEEPAGEGGRPLFIALMGGWGAGYATGNADRTSSLKVSPGFAPRPIHHSLSRPNGAAQYNFDTMRLLNVARSEPHHFG